MRREYTYEERVMVFCRGLTPKGNRWTDVIRKELADPDSQLSHITREFKAWKRLCNSRPKEFQLEIDKSGYISINNAGGDSSHISGIVDVSYLFHK